MYALGRGEQVVNRSILSPARPFSLNVRTEKAFLGAGLNLVLENTVRAVNRLEGISLVTGSTGTGKTLFSHLLVKSLCQTVTKTLFINGGLTTRRALLKSMLHQLGGNIARSGEAELKIAVANSVATNGQVCIVIDDAHKSTNDQLEELQSLAGMTFADSGSVALVLVGQTRLEESLTHPSLQSLNQQISQRSFLKPLNLNQTRDYLSHHVQLVGLTLEDHFDDLAIRAIYDISDGVPRVINQVTDRSVLLACRKGIERLEEYEIQCGWADLQHLPQPQIPNSVEDQCNQAASTTPADATVEFGSLSESVEFGSLSNDVTFDSQIEPLNKSETVEDSLEFEQTSDQPETSHLSIDESTGHDWENDAVVSGLLQTQIDGVINEAVTDSEDTCDRAMLIAEEASEIESELIEVEERLNQHYGRLFDRLRRA